MGFGVGFGWFIYTCIIMVQWKRGVSPIFVSFHFWGDFPLNHDYGRKGTPRKTNVSHENQWLENALPIEIVPFQGTC